MPSSLFFELTSVAQLLPAVVGASYLYRLERDWWERRRSLNVTVAASQRHS